MPSSGGTSIPSANGTDILERIKTGGYQTKFELMRDMALNLFWANRFKMTMYDVRPTRWADVPRSRDDIFIPIQTPWEDRETKVSAVQSAYPGLAAQWDAEVEDSIFEILFDVFGHRRTMRPSCRPSYRRLPNCCLTPVIKLSG